MSIKSLDIFEEMIMFLSILRYIFKSRTKKGLYDLNKQAEPFFRDILNIMYDWDLIRLEEIQKNYAAIDLGYESEDEKICIQVTAQNDSNKLKTTIEKFIEKSYFNKYDRLIFLIITDKKDYTTDFNTQDKLDFSKETDIKDIDDLLTDIEKLSFEKRKKLHDFLKNELSKIISFFAEKSSLLASIEKKISLPPMNGRKFLSCFDYDTSQINKEFSDLKEFYEVLASLPKRTREYLYIAFLTQDDIAIIWIF